jgi:hypothetical protein
MPACFPPSRVSFASARVMSPTRVKLIPAPSWRPGAPAEADARGASAEREASRGDTDLDPSYFAKYEATSLDPDLGSSYFAKREVAPVDSGLDPSCFAIGGVAPVDMGTGPLLRCFARARSTGPGPPR